MTASIAQQQSVPAKDAAAVRKRRRRAPAGGAADDCFTCAKRNIKCDRRRPYCSQCLEIGNDCSGYKTQLTWGVGVASRGKLRGLSLKKTSPARPRASSSTANAAHWSDTDDAPRRNTRDMVDIPADHPGSAPATPFHGYDILAMSQPQNTPPLVQESWGNMPYSSAMPIAGDGPRYQKLGAHLGPLPIVSEALSRSLDSVSDVDYMSPMSHSYTRDDVPFMHSPPIMYDTYSGHGSPIPQSPASAIMIDARPAPTSCPSLVYAASEHSSSLASHLDTFEAQLSQKLMECDTLSEYMPHEN
jgi:Fungal Zn(2)-Cys(6) binuclear cluster domain